MKDNNNIEHIRGDCDIVSIIDAYGVKLKQEGKDYKGLCPFHNDSNPSLVVYPKTQSWHCFGCNKGGDVFAFVRFKENCAFPESVKILAKRANTPIPNWTAEQEELMEKQRIREEILNLSVTFYHEQLLQSPEVLTYLIKERGLTEEFVKISKIGYAALENDDGLLRFLEGKDFAKEQIVETGLIYSNGKEYFTGHIIFPNCYNNRIVYITGRGYPQKSHRKPYADKIPLKHLFFEEVLKRNTDHVIITEGEIDTYTLLQAKFNACGIFGVTSFKEEWTHKFKNIEIVYIALDADEEGKKSALRLGNLLKQKARMLSLPEYSDADGNKIKDWNELLMKKHEGNINTFREVFQHLLDTAPSYIEFKINQIPTDKSKNEILHQVKNDIMPELLSIDAVERDHYIECLIKHLKGHVKITRQSIKEDLKRMDIENVKDDKIQNDVQFLDGNYIELSPAIDFTDNLACVSIPLKTVRMSEQVSKIDRTYYMVTSEKEMFPITGSELIQRKIVLGSKLSIPDCRWQLEHIQQFIKSTDKVNPCEIFRGVRDIYDKYIEFKNPNASSVITLWTIGTYIHRLFESYPYIFLTGDMSTGKSKTLSIAQKLCFNAIHASNITQATIFRIIEGSSCTYLIDEAEQLKDTKLSQEILTLLNSGYTKGVNVPRINTNTYETEFFKLFAPKMIANVKGIGRILESRCIQFTMIRTNSVAKANTVVTDKSEDWVKLRHQMYSFALTYFKEIRKIELSYITCSESSPIQGRELQLWYPLLALAKFFYKCVPGSLYKEIVEAAKKMSLDAKQQGLDEWDEALILAVWEITEKTEKDISPKDIKEGMRNMLSDPKELPSERWIGAHLKKYALIHSRKRNRRGFAYEIKRKAVIDIMQRYGLKKIVEDW